MLIECAIWCYQNSALESGSIWVDFEFDLGAVIAIKRVHKDGRQVIEDDFDITNMSSVWFNTGEDAIVNIKFEVLIIMWREFKKNILLSNNQ